jgi:hypothetical protein
MLRCPLRWPAPAPSLLRSVRYDILLWCSTQGFPAQGPPPLGGPAKEAKVSKTEILAYLVQSKLDQYFVRSKDVKVSIIRDGRAELTSMQLKDDALKGLKLPIRVTHSHARSVRLTFPNLRGLIAKVIRHQAIKLTIEISDISGGRARGVNSKYRRSIGACLLPLTVCEVEWSGRQFEFGGCVSRHRLS